MRYLVFATLLWVHLTAFAEEAPRGRNCELSAPPATAGEEFNHGVIFRIYPRAKDIDAQYSGCQVLLAPDQGTWVVYMLTEIVNGDPVRVWSPDESSSGLTRCLFKDGKVVEGNPASCPMPRFLLMKSMAPGCVEILRAVLGNPGSGASRPKHCEYE